MEYCPELYLPPPLCLSSWFLLTKEVHDVYKCAIVFRHIHPRSQTTSDDRRHVCLLEHIMCRLFSITITTDHSPQPKATLDAALLCYFFPAGDRGAGHRASAPHGPRVHHLPRGAGAPPARHVQPAGPAVGPVGGVQHGTGAYYSIRFVYSYVLMCEMKRSLDIILSCLYIYMFIYMSEGIVSRRVSMFI